MTEENQKIKDKVLELRNDLKKCPFCNSCIEDRTVSLYKGLIDALYKVYCWCGEHRKHEFSTKDIRHLLGRNEYARFGDLVRFGGLVYKPKIDGRSRKAEFGLNMVRTSEFFAGTRDIPVQIVLNQITGEIISEVRCKVNDFPELMEFINEHGLYEYDKKVTLPFT